MKQEHLSDSEIQAGVDGAADADIKRLRRHVAECPQCRAKTDAYQQLAVLLDTDPQYAPAPDLEERVMTAIPTHPARAEHKNIDMILALGGFFLVTATALFMGGWKPLADIMPLFSDIAASGKKMLSGINMPGNTDYLIPCAGLALLLAALFDHTILKKHNGTAS